jgi:PAS domain S-box-containing protein
VNLIDALLLGGALYVLLFAAAGLFAWRSSRHAPLEPGPFWYFAWATLLVSGAAAEVGDPGSLVAFVPPVLSPVFSAFLLAGALRYSLGRVPPALLPAAVGIGLIRAGAELQGFIQLSGFISLLIEPPAAALAGWLVYRESARQHASWLHRLMPICLCAIAVVEVLGAWRAISGVERFVLWPFWLAAVVPLAGLQRILQIERVALAEDESLQERADRDTAIERLGLLASHIRDVISEIAPDGTMVWVSDNCREVLGIEAASLIGRNASEVAAEMEVEEVDWPLPSDPGRSGPDSGLGSRIYSIRNGDGELRWIETRMAHAEVRSGPGRILTTTRDVTDLVLAQQAMRASEERFRTFSLLGSDYCYMSTGGRGIEVDNWITGALEEISGYSHAELQEIGFAGFLHPDDVVPSRDRVLALLEHGGESRHEFRLQTKSGQTRWISEKILVERDGARFTIYGAASDITEERGIEQALARAQKLDSLGLLAGGIAHDFNNLLTVILGSAEMARESADGREELRSDLDAVVEAVDQAQALTQQLLAYAGRGGVERVAVDLTERVRSVSELLAAAGSAGVDLELELTEDLASVVADPGEIQQLAMNLVLNAIEACEGEGRVRVVTRAMHPDEASAESWIVGEYRPDLPYVMLEVSDTGLGMAPETVERVFDPFFTTKVTGRGLGLAAVIGIVRSIDGGIRVESRRHKGTSFVVLVPASDRDVLVRPSRRREAAPRPGRVLIVDDDERVLRVAARMLDARGFEVSTASEGARAIEMFAAREFDLVLLDAVMPGMSGAQTFDALRDVDPDALVLMASGFDMERAVGDLLGRGLAGFIAKPFHAEELAGRISELVGRDS